ncbi:MAG: terminase family protein [Candidatus Binatus sp.]
MAPIVKALPYQREWLRDKSRFKIGMVSRQCGKTKFMGALEIVEDVLEHEARGEKTRWIILSRGERQANEAMEESVKPWFQGYGAVFDELQYDWSDGDGGPRYKASEVICPKGSRVTALPSNPDTARGFTANVLLDEFAFHQDSKKIWGALFPVISRPDLKLRILSTPNGKLNKFYELMTANDQVWSRHTVDIYRAVREGLQRDIEQLKAALNDDDLWQQEFELKWLDEASAWLSFELIMAAEDANAGDPTKYQGGPCFAGNDIARNGDLWVEWVWELVGDILWARKIETLKRATFAEQDTKMDELDKQFHIARVAMDQTGMGEKPVEDAKRRYPGRVDGVLFSQASKQTLANIIKNKFEDRKVRIPLGDLVLRSDLHKVKKITGPTGTPRFIAERDGEGHADRFWAAALGLSAADIGNVKPNIWFGESDADDESEAAIIDRMAANSGIR